MDGIISNKFIKKSLFLITLNDINNYFLNQNMIYFEDGLINYALHLNAKSLYLLNHLGYYYIFNQESASHSINMDSYLKCFFIYLKFFIEKTKNNEYERKIIFFILKEYINQINILKTISNYSHIYDEVIDSMMNIKFINNENKEKIKEFKNIILNLKKK